MKMNYRLAIVVGIVLLIIVCVISVVSGIMSIDVLPENYIGAALGSLIGAIITMVLLYVPDTAELAPQRLIT